MSVIRIIKKFSQILSSHQKFRILEMAILMVIGGFLETCSVSLILPFMNMVLTPEDMMKNHYIQAICKSLDIHSSRILLVIFAVVLAVIFILKNIYLLFETNIQYRFVYGNMFAMQQRLLNGFMHRRYEYFLNINSGEIVRIINNDTNNTFGLLFTILSFFTELIVSVMLVVTLFIIAPQIMFIIAVVLVFLLFCINRGIKPALRNAGLEVQSASTGMNQWLLQSIQGIKELKVMTKEEFFQKNYDIHGRKFVRALRVNNVLNSAPRFIIEAISMATMLLIVAALIYNGADLEWIVPIVSAAAMASIRLLPSVNRISSSLASIAYNEPMLDKLIENLKDFNSDDTISLGIEPLCKRLDLSAGAPPVFRNILNFQEITYHYPHIEKAVLSEASMVIHKGESIGIVGASGAGKTMAVDIILGLLCPQKGNVLVDGIDIQENLNQWLAQIGYIPQSIFMLDDSVRANVAFGEMDDSLSDEMVWRALRDASLEEFVKSLPSGLDAQIGERGVRLSGGQRQRIGIARALYRNPEILIFDEATSALDNHTENVIMESIQKLQGQKKTMIIIAHRLTTIQGCDHVYRVEDGKIVKER